MPMHFLIRLGKLILIIFILGIIAKVFEPKLDAYNAKWGITDETPPEDREMLELARDTAVLSPIVNILLFPVTVIAATIGIDILSKHFEK